MSCAQPPMSHPMALVMRWLTESRLTGEPLREVFVLGSTLARDTYTAAEDACDVWLALRGSCRELRSERGAKNLATTRDTAFYYLELFEEWRQTTETERSGYLAYLALEDDL